MDQNAYTEELEQIEKVEGDDDRELSDREKKAVRGKIGALLWLSLLNRPDLSFDVNLLSREVSVKRIYKIIRKAKDGETCLRFVKLGDFSDLCVRVCADTSFGNQDEATRSTSGRVVILQNKKNHKMCVVSWKTKKIARV